MPVWTPQVGQSTSTNQRDGSSLAAVNVLFARTVGAGSLQLLHNASVGAVIKPRYRDPKLDLDQCDYLCPYVRNLSVVDDDRALPVLRPAHAHQDAH
jgi:hypothetical protein